MTKKKPYYPNNWRQYKQSPDKFFKPLPYDEFMNWKIGGWELPSSVSCIIRETNHRTGKVTEHVYNRIGNAENKARAIMEKGESELCIATRDQIHAVYLNEEEDYDYYDDPLA